MARRPGSTYGTSSIVAAQMVRHELEPESYSLCTALTRALAAMKVNHECGGGEVQEFRNDIPREELKRAFGQDGVGKSPRQASADPYRSYAAAYCTAFTHEIFSDPQLKGQPPSESNLLRDLTGAGFEYVEAKATEIVTRGWEEALKFAPKARYGKYLTVDRGEIEKINEIRSMILSYRSNLNDRQPLSIAVFGPPGSGKSFAIKQLATELFGEDQATIEFNLSQFGEGSNDLHTAFHRVRDASVQGQIPLVFWDEFDSRKMSWLKEFLMPLQDAKFQDGSLVYPFGKSIFIFAGGAHFNFAEFEGKSDGEESRLAKVPDFISRLRGYIDIKGPNPQEQSAAVETSHIVLEAGSSEAAPSAVSARLQDVEHLIRRAILLRSTLERYHSNLVDQKTRLALISPSVVRGFLRVKKFLHGARSLEAVVNMSALTDTNYFGVAELPSPDLLRLHVTEDFLREVHEGQVLAPALEALATKYYEQSRRMIACDADARPGRSKGSAVQPQSRFGELSEVEKEEWRMLARLLPAKLLDMNYRIVPQVTVPREAQRRVKLGLEELQQLRRIEHDVWLRMQLLKGYERGAKTDDERLLHQNVIPFDELADRGESLDHAVAEGLSNVLWKNGFMLVKG